VVWVGGGGGGGGGGRITMTFSTLSRSRNLYSRDVSMHDIFVSRVTCFLSAH